MQGPSVVHPWRGFTSRPQPLVSIALIPLLLFAVLVIAVAFGAGSPTTSFAPPPHASASVSARLLTGAQVPHVRPAATTIDGIDVSSYQGTITWSSVYGAGYQFAFAKAAEGNTCTDSDFTKNAVNGKAAGVYIGAYDFAEISGGSVQACSSGSGADNATAEANYFTSVAGPYFKSGYMYPALDLEQGCSSQGGGNLNAKQMSSWVGQWMSAVESYISTNDGYTIVPVIYMDSSYASSCINSWITQFPVWIANYGVSSPGLGIYSTWYFWQYSSSGSVPGISGAMDMDYFNGNLTDLQQEFIFGTAGPVPPTVTYAMQDTTTGSALSCGGTFAAGDQIQFTATVTGGTSPYNYSWSFGDGKMGFGNPVTHQYASSGSVTPLLTVTDAKGLTATTGTGCTFSVTGTALTASASASPLSGTSPLTVTLTGSASGGSGTYTSWSWNFGDGSAAGTTQDASHVYSAPGSYTATLTVDDNAGHVATATTQTIKVAAAPSGLTVSAAASSTSGAAPLVVQFTGSASGGTAPYAWSWSFGDGSTLSAAQDPTHTFNASGSYSVVLTVTDSAADQASGTLTVQVSAPPAALQVTLQGPSTADLGEPISFSATASGGSGTYSTYAWTFGDSTAVSSTFPTAVHTYAATGTYLVSVTVTDSTGATATSSPWALEVVAPGPALLFGNVQNASSGAAVEDASVTVYASTSNGLQGSLLDSYVTGANGSFRTSVSAGFYLVNATASGFRPAADLVDVRGLGPTSIDLNLTWVGGASASRTPASGPSPLSELLNDHLVLYGLLGLVALAAIAAAIAVAARRRRAPPALSGPYEGYPVYAPSPPSGSWGYDPPPGPPS